MEELPLNLSPMFAFLVGKTELSPVTPATMQLKIECCYTSQETLQLNSVLQPDQSPKLLSGANTAAESQVQYCPDNCSSDGNHSNCQFVANVISL